jgi:hypothetical protein
VGLSFPYNLTNGNTADADEVMANFNQIKNNFDQDTIEDASANATEFQATKLPDTGSLPTSGREEIKTLRYQILQLMKLLKPAVTLWNEVPAFLSAVLIAPFIADSSDATKKIAFDASGITTGNTRTITMPDSDVTLGTLSEAFTSAEQTITPAGSLTIAHGFSSAPSLIQCRLINKTTQHNYSVDDELIINNGNNSQGAGDDRGHSIVMDATNINVRFGSNAKAYQLLDKTSGAAVEATNANWKLIVKAWK